MGRTASASARDEAPWRRRPAPAFLLGRLPAQAQVTTHADALRLAAWERLVLGS